MNELILQAYLNEQHIKTDVNENIESLKKAVKEVNKHLTRKKSYIEIISFTLVALDPMIKGSDSVVQQVEAIIIKNWPAFKNSITATKDNSTTYVRAVILESLNQLTKEDAPKSALVWLTARDVIRHYQLGSEEIIIREFLQHLADSMEKNGHIAWDVNQQLQAVTLKGTDISIPPPKIYEVSQDNLFESLLRASQNSGWKNYSNNIGDNPYAFNQYWASFFSKKAAEGIAEEVNTSLSEQNNFLLSIPTAIQRGLDTYFAQLLPFFEKLNTSLSHTITASNKRSALLWWKQSLYSNLLKTSYRNLDLLNSVVAMAFDLTKQVEPIYPESVDYLLRETLNDVHGEGAKQERSLVDWLNDSKSLREQNQLVFTGYIVEGDERKPLLNAWAKIVQSGKITDFFSETGINPNAKITASDLAVWLFHGLQAQKLATTK